MRPILLAVRSLSVLLFALLTGASAGLAGTTTVNVAPPDLPSANSAGMYHVWSCRTPTGAVAPVDGWAGARHSNCGSGGSFGVAVGTGYDANVPNQTMDWSPAPGLRAVSMELWRLTSGESERGSSPQGGAIVQIATETRYDLGGGSFISVPKGYETIASFGLPGATLGTQSDVRAASNRLLIDPLPTSPGVASPLSVAVNCDNWWNDYHCVARYLVFAADARMLDSSVPGGNGAGALISALKPGASASVGGLAFTVQASDTGSGVLRVVVEIDGQAVSNVPAAPSSALCAPSPSSDGLRGYLVQVPCPPTANVSGSWDTKTVANGTHAVRVLAEDAAGNTTVVASGNVLVDNPVVKPPDTPGPGTPAPTTPDLGTAGPGRPGPGTVGPGTPEETRGASNGSAGSDGEAVGDAAQLTLVWPATGRAPSTKASDVKRCRVAAYANKHPTDCRGRPAGAGLRRSWSTKAQDRLLVTLRTNAGLPIGSARVRLVAEPTAVGAAPVELPGVVTGVDGTAEVAVPRAAGSRTLKATWAARASDTVQGAQSTATLAVGASTTFGAPKRVGPSAMVRFGGTLRGPAGSLGSVPITLQVFNQGRWKTFETATSDVAGSWSVRIQFAPRRGTYPVRVKVGKSPTFPFTPGVAAQSRVRVS